MGRTPKPDNHRTGLQRRLSAEVRAGMESTGCNQADLSRLTGIGEPHISLLLRGLRQGTIGAWDKLIDAAHGRVTAPIRPPEVVVAPDAEEIAVELLKPLGIPVLTQLPHEDPTEMGVAFQRIEAERNHRPAASSLNPRRPT